jgi:hypothetical protein
MEYTEAELTRDDGVPEPVRRGRDTDTTRTNGQRECLADDDPGGGTPGAGEEEDVDADESNLGRNGTRVICLLSTLGDTNGTNNELCDDHANGTTNQQGTTAKSLNGPERDGGREHVDESSDQGDQEGVLDRAKLVEEGCAEVLQHPESVITSSISVREQ